jgi:rare lipoprotein A (peptidoglycan hydrolase)
MRKLPLAVIGVGSLLLAGCSSAPDSRTFSATSTRDNVAHVAAPRRTTVATRRIFAKHHVAKRHTTEAPGKTAMMPGDTLGVASYYHAAGLTAAHRSLPFGTRVRVTNMKNGRAVVVRIADRGPFIRGRTIDLSHGAAEAVGMTEAGVVQVKMEVIK